MVSILQKHCSDEDLVAYLDDELRPRARKSVKNHLGSCWICRARLRELDDQALAVAKAVQQDVYPGPGRLDRAICEFTEWREQVACRWAVLPRFRLLPRSVLGRASALAAGVAIILAASLIHMRSVTSAQEVEQFVSAARQFERSLFEQPVYQNFTVELNEVRPRQRTTTGKLEIWSGPSQGRFASRWTGSDGILRHAVWRPSSASAYVYNPVMSGGSARSANERAKPVSLVELPSLGLEPQALESGLTRWLENRRWRPISFASTVSEFASQEGVLMRVTRARAPDGTTRIVLSARRQTATMTAELSVEVDAESYCPRLQRIRFETPAEAVELKLLAERVEAVPPSQMTAAVFEPSVPVETETPHGGRQRAASDVPQGTIPAISTSAPLTAAEIEALYALHRAGACLGEPVEVVRESDGSVVVRGIAKTGERKAALLAELAELHDPVWLQFDIKTIEEAMRTASAAYQTAGARQADDTGATESAQYSMQFEDRSLPIQAVLETYLRRQLGHVDGDSLREAVGEFTGDTVTLSESMMEEVWALRRLAERFNAGDIAGVETRTKWLLEVMLRDHLRAFRSKADSLRNLLDPVLTGEGYGDFKPSGADEAEVEAHPRTGDSAVGDGDWNSQVLDLFDVADGAHRRVLGVFAGAGLPAALEPGEAGSPHRLRVESPEEAVETLVRLLPVAAARARGILAESPWNESSRAEESIATMEREPAQ